MNNNKKKETMEVNKHHDNTIAIHSGHILYLLFLA
jgi:hypothetical protein